MSGDDQGTAKRLSVQDRSKIASAKLESWATTLGFLEAEVAAGLEPMAKRLAIAMPGYEAVVEGLIEPNGYGGIARKGDLKRLLISDWAMLDFDPNEFMRRFVSAELSYLEIARSAPRPPGQILVLVDSGPRQAGTPRLAHLAALVVLDRRARALGVPLRLGSLGDPSSEWTTGALPELIEAWLASRTSRHPTQADVDRWASAIEPETRLWLFGGDCLDITSLGAGAAQLSAVESAWGPQGATCLRVTAAGKTLDLDLPERQVSLRIIRGSYLRRGKLDPGDRVDANLRFPRFPAANRKLLCRTDREDELVSFVIPNNHQTAGGKAKRRRFRGRVIAASFVGPRTVAVLVNDDVVEVEVVGKRLANLNAIQIDRSRLRLDDQRVDQLCSTDLAPVFFASGALLLPINNQWWRIDPHGVTQEASIADCGVGPSLDQPRLVTGSVRSRYLDNSDTFLARDDQDLLLGPNRTFATNPVAGTWEIYSTATSQHDQFERRVIRVNPNARLLGLTLLNDGPVLVEHSRPGRLIRLHSPTKTSTVTKFSGDIESAVLHPMLPILAIERSDNTILVVDLNTQERLHRIVGGATS